MSSIQWQQQDFRIYYDTSSKQIFPCLERRIVLRSRFKQVSKITFRRSKNSTARIFQACTAYCKIQCNGQRKHKKIKAVIFAGFLKLISTTNTFACIWDFFALTWSAVMFSISEKLMLLIGPRAASRHKFAMSAPE